MIEFAVYDKGGSFRRRATPLRSHTELLWNRVSTAELAFDDDDRVWADLQPGARVRAYWDGEEVLRGPLRRRSGTGPTGTITATIHDDFRLFSNLGWPKPASAITAQTDEYRTYTGPTETVVKTACAELSARLGLGWVIPPSTGAGRPQRVEMRFHPLTDKLVPILEADLLTWSIRDRTVDVKLGDLFPRILTPESGVLTDYQWTETAPEATRVVVGGGGQGVERVLRQYIDSALEAEFADIVEVFKDSRMAGDVTDLKPDADQVLADGAPRASVKSTLAENSWFRFGEYRVGSRVTVNVGPVTVTDVIRSVVINDSADEGVRVTPSLGEVDDTAEKQLRRQLVRLSRALRDQGRR